jgi:hypothetical protein
LSFVEDQLPARFAINARMPDGKKVVSLFQDLGFFLGHLVPTVRASQVTRLLIEAGRIPEELKPALSIPQIPALLRATEKLSDSDLQEVLKTVQALAVKHHRRERNA